MKNMKKLIATAALALTVAAVATGSASASAATDATLQCAELTGSAMISLPGDSPSRYSIFYYRIDRAQWQTTTWYYTYSAYNYYYDFSAGRWYDIPFGATAQMPNFTIGGHHVIDAWEYRYEPAGYKGWVNLGSCTTSSIDGGGITFTYGG